MSFGETGCFSIVNVKNDGVVRVAFANPITEPILACQATLPSGTTWCLAPRSLSRDGFDLVLPEAFDRAEIRYVAMKPGRYVLNDGTIADSDGKGSTAYSATAMRSAQATSLSLSPCPQGNAAEENIPTADTIHLHGAPQAAPVVMSLGTLSGLDTNQSLGSCFTRDCRVETPKGPRRVRDLRPGDLVQTADKGLQQVIWLGRTRLSRQMLESCPELRPVRLRRGALGAGVPAREVVLSPQHLVAITDKALQARFGRNRVLVPVQALIDGETVETLPANRGWTYYHLLLPQHCLVMAEGCVAESLSASSARQLALPGNLTSMPVRNGPAPLPVLTEDAARDLWGWLKQRPRSGKRKLGTDQPDEAMI